MNSQLFASPSELKAPPKRFGHVYNGKYHMPLLPGEAGTKAGGNYVPYGLTRVTRMVGAFEDTRALSIWEQGMGLIGLALAPEIYEELVVLVEQAAAEGVIFERLRDYVELKEALAGDAHDQDKQEASIIGRAKRVAKAHSAALKGTVRHIAWEHFGNTGNLIGTPAVRESTLSTARLLAEAGLELVADLQERMVRNLTVKTCGKFDNTVLEKATGRLIMADLKTKATAFYSWMTVDAQEATYARSEWMLTRDGQGYEEGPVHYVDLTEGAIMHVPSDGAPPYLRRADLEYGWEVAQVARRNMDLRAHGKSAGRHAMSPWTPAEITS